MRAFSIPMRTRFRGLSRRDGALIQGPAGWGEFSPFAEYGPTEASRWLAAACEAAFESWPTPLRRWIPVNVTVAALEPDLARQVVLASGGCRTAKVKVAEPGQTDAQDVARVEAVRDALGPSGRVRVDANGGWDVDHAVRMIRLLNRFDLEYVEQPCASMEELALVRRRVAVPVAADESIRRVADPVRIRDAQAADIVVLKVQPLGGVANALRVARAIGLPAVVSSAVETSIGLAAGLALAAALPDLPYACGLATLPLLDGDVVADPLVVVDGQIEVRRPVVDERALARFETDPCWWRQRAEAAALAERPPSGGR